MSACLVPASVKAMSSTREVHTRSAQIGSCIAPEQAIITASRLNIGDGIQCSMKRDIQLSVKK